MFLKKALIHRLNLQCSRLFHASYYHPAKSTNVANVFDMVAKTKQRNRQAYMKRINAVSGAEDTFSYLKDEVAYRMADRIVDVKRQFGKAVEWGCDYGFLSKHLSPDCIGKLYMCDAANEVLTDATTPSDVPFEKVLLNENLFPFDDSSIDLVVSSLRLHWVNDLPGLFSQFYKGLKNDGCFLGVMFAGDTLFELRVALQLADLERQGGLTPRISPFTDNRDLGSLLSNAGFTLLTLDIDEITIHYPTMFELLNDLRGMSETNCSWNRQLRLNRDVMISAASIYAEMFGQEMDFDTGDENGEGIIEKRFAIPATFQLLHFIAWKPDPSQPKPAKRGSGQVSIADVGELDRMIKESAKSHKKD